MKSIIKIIIIIIMLAATIFSAAYSYKMITQRQEDENTVVAFSIKQLPNKLEYWDGELFDPTGLVLVVQYADGTVNENFTEGFEWDLKSPLTSDNDEVKISLGTKAKYIEISVNVRTPLSLTVLQQPDRLIYASGEKFSPDGMQLLAVYEDGTENILTDGFMYPSTKLQEGATSVAIRYNGKTVDVPIFVTPPAKSVQVVSAPTNTSYMAGQFFDQTGMSIIATFEDDSTMDITKYVNLSTKRLKESDTKITFNVLGQTFEQAINVSPNPHVKAQVFAEIPETCTEDGKKSYVTCSHCDKFFTDEYLAYEITDITIAKHHILAASEENPASGVQIRKCIRCESDESESPVIYHNFTKADIIDKNNTILTDTSGSTSKNIQNANQFAYNMQYMLNFKQEGDGVQYTFVADKAGRVTVVLKMSSAFFKTIYRSGTERWSTGDMQLNLVADIKFNGELISFEDKVMLYGADHLMGSVAGTTEGNQSYANTVNWQYIAFEIDAIEGENTISVQTKACTKYIDINNTASGYASFALDTVAIYGDIMLDESDTVEISETVKEYLHNFTAEDQSAINTNPPEGRFNITHHHINTATSANVKKALAYAYGGDYLTHFYGGAAVKVNFTSTVEGKATVTFKMSSSYITKMQNFSLYETGDMIVNKIMKITANGNEVVFGDDVVLKGDKTRQDYSCMGMWTLITFEMDVQIGENTIVLTSLYPIDGEGNLLYNDPGTNGTQSSFNLDTMLVSMGVHEHNYGEYTSVDNNNHQSVCICGEKKTAAHVWNSGVETKAPSHLEAGEKTYTCTDCGHTKTEEIPKITAHSFGEWTKLDENNHQRECECGEKETFAHTWDDGVITQNPTEEIEGIKLYTCADCGYTKNISIGTLGHTHKFATQWSMDADYHWYATTCGHDSAEGLLNKIAHNWDNGVETKPATHLEAGVMTYTCTDCAYTKTEDIPKTTAHSFGAWTKVDGSTHQQVCACGEKNTAAHSFNDGVITKEPTENSNGVKTYTCTDCGHTKTETIDRIEVGDITSQNTTFTHNYTAADQSAQNKNPPENRKNLTYHGSASTSANIKKALALATDGDYLTHFYDGAAATVNFTSSVSGKATLTFKIASGYITKMQNYSIYETGDMVVNKIMKITVNGKEIAIGDDVVLKGDNTKQSYAAFGVWTYISFEIDVKAGNNTVVLTSIFPDDGAGKPIYKDPDTTGTQSSFQLDTVTVSLTLSYDLTADNDNIVHNFTGADQTAKNDNNPPSNRVNVSYVSTATASATAQLATKLATNEDYLGQFYGGAAVTYSFTSSVSGKATITFKISSGYLTKVSGTKYETGDMVVNKVMKITVNGEEIIFGDDVVLNGDKTKQSYACMANWTYLTFEVDLLKGANTIVLTSLYPVDGEGNLLYKDPGTNGTQSSFLLDTVSVALVKPDLSNEVNSFTHNYTTADQSAKNNENPPKDRVNVNYVSTAGASATAQLATKLATNEDYLSYFYGGAAVSKTFISTVAGKATVTFKIASGYLTKVQNPVYESGDMVVNKVMKITVNNEDVVLSDDLVLNGDTTTQTYACLANWTYVTFEIDVVEGKNTIVLTSLCPKDENGEPLYKDPGVDGTQSSFHLDTVTVTMN